MYSFVQLANGARPSTTETASSSPSRSHSLGENEEQRWFQVTLGSGAVLQGAMALSSGAGIQPSGSWHSSSGQGGPQVSHSGTLEYELSLFFLSLVVKCYPSHGTLCWQQKKTNNNNKKSQSGRHPRPGPPGYQPLTAKAIAASLRSGPLPCLYLACVGGREAR
jgi:hypothetical protein